MGKIEASNYGWKEKRENPRRLKEGMAIMYRSMEAQRKKDELNRKGPPPGWNTRVLQETLGK